MEFCRTSGLCFALAGCAVGPCPSAPPPQAPSPPAPVAAQPVTSVAPAPQPAPAASFAQPGPAVPAAQSDTFPGWFVNGTRKDSYRAVHDRDVKQSGSASARLESILPVPSGFGGIMQSVDPVSFRGKRIRFSALVKTQGVERKAGLWMRVDRPEQHSSAFDNMQDRAIRGTTEWARYDVVLDVAKDASTLNFGLLLNGPGTAWLDDVKLEVVDSKVPTTDTRVRNAHRSAKPANLDFEE